MRELEEIDILYGISDIVISITFFILYIPVVVGFFQKADLSNATFTFRLMIFVSCVDMLQLTCHFTVGASLLLALDEDHFVFYIIGAILAGSWFLMLMLTLTLTVQRILLVVFSFAAKRILRPHVTWGITFICFSVWIGVFILNLTPYCGMYYFPLHYWQWDFETPLGSLFNDLDVTLMCSVCVVSLILYAMMFLYIYLKQEKKLQKAELRIAYQMFSFCFFTIFVCMVWKFGYLLIPDETSLLWYFSDMLWPIWNGVNSILYLIFNKTLRSSLKTVITVSTREQQSRTITTVSTVLNTTRRI